ncbi:MAG: nucleoside-diphosphate sugar epimerase/dehydratase [Tissierellaceae bacterium]|nr:nucleoside-diphosphate sugar epimerase/dehydratase [Tissierellaceae bacterium]
MERRLSKLSRIALVFMDLMLINLAYLLALFIRFEGVIDTQFLSYLPRYLDNAIYITIIKIGIFYYFKMYKTMWRYASITELYSIVTAIMVSNAAVLSFLFIRQANLPRSIYILTTLIDMTLVGGLRFSFRAFDRNLSSNVKKKDTMKRIMIIGAGDAGVMVIREYRNHVQLNSKPVVIIDDDIKKQGQVINGVPVVGGRQSILSAVDSYHIDEIIIAIPSASRKETREIIDICKETKCKLKILPGIYELIDGNVSIKKIRDVEIGDLLGREEIKVDLDEISSYIANKVVMVTGGGGSIGSELCRQIAGFKPKELIILDIYENTAYDIQNELKRKHSDLKLKVLIGSIRDKSRIHDIFREEKPDVVFHAAAHKHVPLMEDSPKEAIKNNVFGTLNLVQAADIYNVKKFVMISTDKAVNPTNIMGASKRICEMIVQSMNVNSKTDFVAVRFGNVLGSNGSVIPLFKKQIENGGPVTVTHQDIIRYFMTIPEAVQLVIQAGAMAKGGEIFILDMGEPVKIIDLAKDLIRLSGFEPGVDIPIEITGLRPGEKLFEELLLDEEGILNTKHDKIFIGKPTFTDYRLLLKSLDELNRMIKEEKDDKVIQYVRHIVPTYKDNNEVNEKLLNLGN